MLNPYAPYTTLTQPRQGLLLVKWSKVLSKIALLGALGFLIPVAMLLPVHYAMDDIGFGSERRNLVGTLLPPAFGCCVLFTLSAIASSVSKNGATFVQSLFLIGTTFILAYINLAPLHHYKSDEPPSGGTELIPIIAVAIMFSGLVIFAYARKIKTVILDVGVDHANKA